MIETPEEVLETNGTRAGGVLSVLSGRTGRLSGFSSRFRSWSNHRPTATIPCSRGPGSTRKRRRGGHLPATESAGPLGSGSWQ